MELLDFDETTVGFMLPSAGLSPAPSEKRKMARTPFCSQVLFFLSPASCVIPSFFLCHPERRLP
jgi:hypothetical protein